MIRRQVGDEFFLIAQDDHARLSGRIAEHFGNERFTPPQPRAETIAAISMHDCGWPLHDEKPELNKSGQPLDVFESPVANSLRVWTAAADQAEAYGPYAGLLVSLHVLGLSGLAASHPHDRHDMFELNRFQHREIERQQVLRQKVGLSTTRPTHMGLATDDGDPAEQELKRNHSIVQVHDRLSLAICCSEVPFGDIEGVIARPGEPPIKLKVYRTSRTSISVGPWPFDQERLIFGAAYRAVPAITYSSRDEFRAAYERARLGELELAIYRS